MNAFLQGIADFALGTSVWVYLFIFFGKILEVSCGTLRIVLINRGERSIGSVVAFIEIVLWLVIASSVLVGFREDYLKGLVYAFAFALGNYLGSILDDRLAFGLCSVQVIITDPEKAYSVEAQLRKQGFGVTSLDVHGRYDDHCMLLMTMQRKRCQEAVSWLESHCPGSVITISDVKVQHGSYMKKSTRSGLLRIGK
ncbi:MAG: DUF5698 domain-containing protein [Clostridia bacterium]|nr:DUF5698 domain-containing protein [Clostridia bacterium]